MIVVIPDVNSDTEKNTDGGTLTFAKLFQVHATIIHIIAYTRKIVFGK